MPPRDQLNRKPSSRRANRNSGDVFEAERIIDHRFVDDGGLQVLMKWKGYGTGYNTWEPIENILSSDLLDSYLDELGGSGEVSVDELDRIWKGAGRVNRPLMEADDRDSPEPQVVRRSARIDRRRRVINDQTSEESDESTKIVKVKRRRGRPSFAQKRKDSIVNCYGAEFVTKIRITDVDMGKTTCTFIECTQREGFLDKHV
ncbi:hypothetical protein ACOME3_001890 [Neoechinorhynchus agilis]